MHELSVEQARHALRKLHRAYGHAPEPVAAVTDVPMARPRVAGGPLVGRLYRPCHAGDEPLPAVLWLHGGGWTVGDVDAYDAVCRQIANRSGAAVFAIDYRLAPEHPFPAALDDAMFALDWLAAHGAGVGVDPARLALAGDSAGGNLAAVTALAARDAGWPTLRFLWLICAALDLQAPYPSREHFGDGYLLDAPTLTWFMANYLDGVDVPREDWRLSPLAAPRLDGLPPTLVQLAAFDPLLDEGLAFAERLREERVPCDLNVAPGMIHGFFCLGRLLPEADAAVARGAQALQSAFRLSGRTS